MLCSICGRNTNVGWQSDTYKREFACMECDETVCALVDVLCVTGLMSRAASPSFDVLSAVPVLVMGKNRARDEAIHALRSVSIQPVQAAEITTGPTLLEVLAAPLVSADAFKFLATMMAAAVSQ